MKLFFRMADCKEAEFLAENELISIVPNFTEDTVHLISGDIGPFEAGMALEVPLWLALYLKERHLCQIIPPNWLKGIAFCLLCIAVTCNWDVENLEELVALETDDSNFTKVPPKIMEISHLLLHRASDEIADGDKLKILIKDLWDARQAKMRKSTASILQSTEETYARLDNLSQMEITVARPFLTASLNALRKIQSVADTIHDEEEN